MMGLSALFEPSSKLVSMPGAPVQREGRLNEAEKRAYHNCKPIAKRNDACYKKYMYATGLEP